jgi:hypothetical protein
VESLLQIRSILAYQMFLVDLENTVSFPLLVKGHPRPWPWVPWLNMSPEAMRKFGKTNCTNEKYPYWNTILSFVVS